MEKIYIDGFERIENFVGALFPVLGYKLSDINKQKTINGMTTTIEYNESIVVSIIFDGFGSGDEYILEIRKKGKPIPDYSESLSGKYIDGIAYVDERKLFIDSVILDFQKFERKYGI